MSQRINTNKLESVWYGPPPEAAPTLVFLHEGLGCVSLWKDFPEKLANKTACGALVFSRLGYGKSASCELPRALDFMHLEALTELPEMLSQYKIHKCILVGALYVRKSSGTFTETSWCKC